MKHGYQKIYLWLQNVSHGSKTCLMDLKHVSWISKYVSWTSKHVKWIPKCKSWIQNLGYLIPKQISWVDNSKIFSYIHSFCKINNLKVVWPYFILNNYFNWNLILFLSIAPLLRLSLISSHFWFCTTCIFVSDSVCALFLALTFILSAFFYLPILNSGSKLFCS